MIFALLVAFFVVGCGDRFTISSQQPQGIIAQNQPQAIPNQLIVKYKGIGEEVLAHKLFHVQGVQVLDSFYLDDHVVLIQTPENRSLSEIKTLYESNPTIDWVQENYTVTTQLVPNDPKYSEQWYLGKIGANQAWDVTMGDPSFIVSVVDTGVDYTHPELAGKGIKGPDFTGETGKPEDPKNDSIDAFGHGTHVAGIIGAIGNNNEGVIGVAPHVQIMSVKVLSSKGGGSLFSIAKGISYSAENGAKVINLSLGGPAVKDVISSYVGWRVTKKYGVLLVAAAGNSGGPVGTPARIQDYYMAVGATNDRDELTKFSCFGPELSVTAPGDNIMSTTPTYHVPLNDFGYPMNYASLRGTSMSAPIVAGQAALIWTLHPDWTYQEVRKKIEDTVLDLGDPGKDNTFGYGRINIVASVQ